MKAKIVQDIQKIVLIASVPAVIVGLFVFTYKPVVIIAFLLGELLGIIRLRTLLTYINSVLDINTHKTNLFLIKYILNLFLCLSILSIALYLSSQIGISIVLGVISVPIILMIYAGWQGILLRK